MVRKEENDIELLLSTLNKEQLCEFLRAECANDSEIRQRFLSLGAGTIFTPSYADYQARIMDIIDDFGDKHGYVRYSQTFSLNCAICKILDEADVAMTNHRWDVAIAILEGASSVAEDILNCGDDSAGELGGIIDECFAKWHKLCSHELLPADIKTRIFNLSVNYFTAECLKGFDWWWDWIQMAIFMADTSDRQNHIITILDDFINTQGDDSCQRYHIERAQRYKLEIMSKSLTPEGRRKFLYDNVTNPDFRRKLLQMAWDNENIDEVLQLATGGVAHDSEYGGLVNEWRRWELNCYLRNDDKQNVLKLSRYFFFAGGRFGDMAYSMEVMYAQMKSIVPNEEWADYVATLLKEASEKRDDARAVYIYTQEKMWENYMQYLRNTCSIYDIDEAPQEVWNLYKEELLQIYTASIRRFFEGASNRNSYCQGVEMLRNLIAYGGKAEAEMVVSEQMSRTPRRPALIDELSKLQK